MYSVFREGVASSVAGFGEEESGCQWQRHELLRAWLLRAHTDSIQTIEHLS